ncbi:MAG: hypothetical protein K6U89_17705, partial [Chloroflexi bacterium]|nr:hypothetical protein [Chloroflexota bacterium]
MTGDDVTFPCSHGGQWPLGGAARPGPGDFPPPPVHAQPQTWKVIVGAGGDAPNVSLDQMYPKSLMIHVGDTVSFERTVPGPPHTVTFLSGSAPPPLFLPVPDG